MYRCIVRLRFFFGLGLVLYFIHVYTDADICHPSIVFELSVCSIVIYRSTIYIEGLGTQLRPLLPPLTPIPAIGKDA